MWWWRRGLSCRRTASVLSTALVVAAALGQRVPGAEHQRRSTRRRRWIADDDVARTSSGTHKPTASTVWSGAEVPEGETCAIAVYRQLGTWVDVYDYAPAFGAGAGTPQLTPAAVDAMAAAGIRTLYLQASINSQKASGILEAPNLLGAFLTRAHARGMQVVAWYLPTFTDINADLQRLRAMRDFRSGEQGFDGVAVDIEWTAGVTDTARRNAALVDLSRAISSRDRNGDRGDRATARCCWRS